jgi:uncharacterized protein YdeI (YjbR/CyaY-like superfamily)
MSMEMTEAPLECANAGEWRTWLEHHHDSRDDVWLVIFKKHAASRGVTFAEATEEALCFGWIDSAMRPIDEDRFALRYTPRRQGSNWSNRNRALAERLIEQARMTPAGLAKIREAQQSGRWE